LDPLLVRIACAFAVAGKANYLNLQTKQDNSVSQLS
jgi:hypothetical protein